MLKDKVSPLLVVNLSQFHRNGIFLSHSHGQKEQGKYKNMLSRNL